MNELAQLDPFPFSSMLYRLLFGRGNRFLCLFTGLRRASSTEAEAVDVYVAANRTRFYRTLGIFTLVQGVAWSAFGTYLFSKRNEKLTWQMMRRDIYEFNRLIADRLESWTPETVKKLILRSRKTLVLDEPAISVADEAQPEPMECVLNSAVVETEEPELKRFADKVKEAFGVLRPDRAALEKEDIKSRRLIPYICFAMGASLVLLFHQWPTSACFGARLTLVGKAFSQSLRVQNAAL